MTGRRHGYYSHWCALLGFHLKRKRLTLSAFAATIDRSQQIAHAYAVGRARPPLAEIPKWADALGLAGFERDQFVMAAYEAWTPEPVWARLAKLESLAKANLTPSDSLAVQALRRCQAAVSELVGLLAEAEGLFYTRNITADKIRPMRAKLGWAIRKAIEAYSTPPAST